MTKASGYIEVSDGLIVIFNKEIPFFEKGVSLGYTKIGDEPFLVIGENHCIPLKGNILKALERAINIYVTVGGNFEIITQGAIPLDKITVGKIIAYSEMEG